MEVFYKNNKELKYTELGEIQQGAVIVLKDDEADHAFIFYIVSNIYKGDNREVVILNTDLAGTVYFIDSSVLCRVVDACLTINQ